MLTSNEYVSEIKNLEESIKSCEDNHTILELQMIIVTSLVKEDKTNHSLLRLQTKVNERYFINQEMILILNAARKYLKEVKEVDSVFCNYLDRYYVLVKRIIEISKDQDFKELSARYLKQDEINKSL